MAASAICTESRPARACGLKLQNFCGFRVELGVAPRAGVWIETLSLNPTFRGIGVAPRAGVWIET